MKHGEVAQASQPESDGAQAAKPISKVPCGYYDDIFL
jgi:hypothetical protein